MSARPPRVARWLLRRFLPRDVRPSIVGDLNEVYLRNRRDGRIAARIGYWREAIAVALRMSGEVRRERREAARHRPPLSHRLVALGREMTPGTLDLKIGARRLAKHPVLSIVSGIAIAASIGVSAGVRDFVGGILIPEVTTPGSARVVRLLNWDALTSDVERRALWDLEIWQQSLRSVEGIGALMPRDLNLVTDDGVGTPVSMAEISASAFEILGVEPSLGRPLLAGDEAPDADAVAVIGYGLWQSDLGGRSDVIGRSIRLGPTSYTIVGVMPEGFVFPIDQDVWIPFRRHHFPWQPRSGPGIITFAALPRGVSLEQAQAELTQIGLQSAAANPETHEHLRPRVQPFIRSLLNEGAEFNARAWGLFAINSFFILLTIVACTNMGTLVFARTAAASSEITIRAALGASRARLVTQVFVEALLLSLIAAGLGMYLANWVVIRGSELFFAVQYQPPPSWWTPGLSTETILYGLALSVLAACVVGVVPALRATGAHLHSRLQRGGAGTSSMRFGFVSTAIIVVQVAIGTAFLPIALSESVSELERAAGKQALATFPIDEYLGARLEVDDTIRYAAGEELSRSEAIRRYHDMRESFAEQLRAEPGVRSVTFTNRLAGINGQSIPRATVRPDDEADESAYSVVLTGSVDEGFFAAGGLGVLAGRSFEAQDFGQGRRLGIVNEKFANTVLGGRNPVGLRVWVGAASEGFARVPDTPIEIIGLVSDGFDDPAAAQSILWLPIDRATDYPLRMMVRVDGDPREFFPRLRSVASTAAPGILIDELIPLAQMRRDEMVSQRFVVYVILGVTLLILALSGAGIFALMSFTVSQRSREIGIRRALGAPRGGVVRKVFARAFLQIGLGVVVGGTLSVWAASAGALDSDAWSPITTFVVVALVMFAIGAAACLSPLLRGLRIEPTEALRIET